MEGIIQDLKKITDDYDYGNLNINALISNLESVINELEEFNSELQESNNEED